MRLCFLVEERYRNDSMPLAVARQLAAWGHHIDVLEPGASVVRISELIRECSHDAWVLKTVSGGPGLTLLEAAAASGLTTINDARAIQPVRDKAVAAAVARRHGLPFPLTYFAAVPQLLSGIPVEHYPLVVKPAGGSSGRAVHLVATPSDLTDALGRLAGEGFLLAQPYVVNPGIDVKVYNTGGELHATVTRSPLHPEVLVRERVVPLPAELAQLGAAVGEVFGLDLYGFDAVEGPEGWVIVDINDFPSFRAIPDAAARVARTIARLAGPARRVRITGAVPAGSEAHSAAEVTVAAHRVTPQPVTSQGAHQGG